MDSAEIRNEIIATITNALLYPEVYGDRFFAQLVSSDDRGFVPLTLIQNMIKELDTVPVKYIEHCADKEPDRLQLSIDRTKIRIAGQYEDDPMDERERETDAYGKQQQQQQTIAQERKDTSSSTPPSTPSSPSSFKTAPSSPIKEEEEGTEPPRNKASEYFRPYIPSYASKQSIAAPIYYNNGKFYNDERELNKIVGRDRPVEVPSYERLEVDTIGDSRIRENVHVCWNCGSEVHKYSDCPKPRNDAMVNEYRKRLKKNAKGQPNMGRFFMNLEFKDKIDKLHPGRISLQLQEALGMDNRYPEPPYYSKMRQHGYPPGYWGTPEDKDALLSQWNDSIGCSEELLYENVPELNIYTDAESYEQNHDEDDEGPVISVGTNERVKLVHYPGLETRSELRKHRHTTTTTPHLDYTYAPAYYLENSQPYSKTTRTTTADNTTTTVTATVPTAHVQTTAATEVYPSPSPVPPTQGSQEQYYYSYYYQHSQQQQYQPSVPYYPHSDYPQPVQSSISGIPQLEQPVSYLPEKADEKMDDGESDMDISDVDD